MISFTKRVAYIATKGYIRIAHDHEELKNCKEYQDWMGTLLMAERRPLMEKHNSYMDKAFRLYFFQPFTDDDTIVFQFRKEADPVKSYLEFVHIIYNHVNEDYKLLDIKESKPITIPAKRDIPPPAQEKEKPKEDYKLIDINPEELVGISWVYIHKGRIDVLKNGEYIGYIAHGYYKRKIGWHTFVPGCMDLVKPHLYATYMTIEYAKERIRKEHPTN